MARSQTLQPLNPLVTESLLERAQIEHRLGAKRLATAAGSDADAWRIGTAWRLKLDRGAALAGQRAVKDAEEWMWCAEALHAIEHTMCLSLGDFYLRRTHLVLARGGSWAALCARRLRA